MLIIFSSIHFNCYSQKSSYNFTNLNTSDGLSQSSVTKIYQDIHGQLWVGTRNGLNKYDGNSFKVFLNDLKDDSSISNNDIISITEDQSGNIWIGTHNGLNKYDPVTETFERFLYNSNNDNTLPNNIIIDIKSIDDDIWIGTYNGLSIYNKERHTFTNIYHKTHDENSIPDNRISKILKTKKNAILIGTGSGLCKLISRKNNKFIFQRFTDGVNTKKSNLYIGDLAEDKFGSIWVGTRNNGLYKANIATNMLYELDKNELFKTLDKDIRSMSFDHQNNLWLGTLSGISILNSNGTLNSSVTTNANMEKVKSVFTDANGSIWIGTYYGALNFWNETYKNFNKINYKNFDGYAVSSIVGDQNGHVYFGTEGNGVIVLDSRLNTTTYINKEINSELSSDNIKSMMLKDNEIWLGTHLSGISIYNIKTKKIDNSSLSIELKNLLKHTGVYSIKKENDNIIWIGIFGKGIVKYNLITKTIEQLNSSHGFTNNDVRNIFIDTKKRIWIGTHKGLNSFSLNDFENGKFNFKHYFYNPESDSGTDIFTVFEDSKHNIWVGTKDKGLFKIVDEAIEKVNIKKGDIEISTIHAIIEDSNNVLWISSNKGIVKYNTLHKTFNIYNHEDGLMGNEFISNAALKLKNQFYFGGIGGASTFSPEKIVANTYSSQVILTDFKIKNKRIKVDSSKILNKSITYTKNITLAYNNSSFSIKFAAPNFVSPSNNLYSYRLVGLVNQWTTTTNNEVSYTIQNPGTYIFEVRGANNEGVWNNDAATLEIVLKPAPWKTWWAYTIYFLLSGFIFYYVTRFVKSKEILKYKLELKHAENERKEEINKAKLNFFTNISHEFRTPLTLILGPLQQILLEYKGSNILYKKLLVIESSANHLLQLINRLMDFRKFEENQFKIEAAQGNVVKFLQEIFLSFTEFAKNGNYNYTFNSSKDEIVVYYDHYKLERVFYNLISNAFRYTPKGGSISINIKEEQNHISISIDDTGVGISNEYLDKIFDHFFEIPIHNKPHEIYKKGTGIGLSIAKNIVKMHHGRISVQNKIDDGVIFKVTLPRGKSHLSEQEILKDFTISDDISHYTAQLNNFPVANDKDINDLIIEEKKYTILLVEDNNELRSFMKNLLKKNYNVLQAENGKVAMKSALKNMPDLIISDVLMPEMVGTELCSLIKGNINTSHISVILLTSRTSLIYKFEGLESGADDYINKPFNLKEFKLRINNLLESKERLKNKFLKEDFFKTDDITVTSLDQKLLKQALKLVETNISNEQFDIKCFARELGVSRTLLFTKIKAWANITPNEFIIEMRMKRAIQLLQQSEISISEVSDRVGFKDPKYFSKCFRKKNQLSPTQFRNQFLKRNPI